MKHIVILVPGIMGSRLKLGDELIWPGPVSSLIFPYEKMNELLRPDLRVDGCIRSFAMPQYQAIIDDLENCGFSEADGTLVIGAYDWRKSVEDGALTLAHHIDGILAKHGPDIEISVVAHSMGGLVSRYFLESGSYTTKPGWEKIKRLITIGTPHRGAAIAIPLVLGYEKKLFLSKEQVRQLASNKLFLSPYQLLPRPGEPVCWGGSTQTDVSDFFNPGIAGKLGLVPENLKSAQMLHRILDKGFRPNHVRYFCFSGHRQPTTVYVRLQPKTGDKLWAAKMDQEDGGDGTVPIWSSTLSGTQFLYVAGEHGTLYKNDVLRTTLAALLGQPGRLAAGKPMAIALRNLVVAPNALVHATLILSKNTTEMDGSIIIERMEIKEDAMVDAKEIASHPISYKGPVTENFLVALPAPSISGFYRVSFVSMQGEQSAFVELIVQA